MNSPIPTQTLIHRLILTSAALLVYADGALAADFVGDAQMQARALLTATSGARPNAVDNRITPPTDGHQISNIDAQEQARQLLSGTSNVARTLVGRFRLTRRKAQNPPSLPETIQFTSMRRSPRVG